MSSKRPWSADETFLRCVYMTRAEKERGDDGDDVNIRLVCNLCSSDVGDATKKGRFLPLPSVDWQELAPEWFCGCKAPNNSDGQKTTKDCVGGGGCSDQKKKACPSHNANSNLQVSPLDPKPGDVFWAPGFVRVNRSMVDAKRASVTSSMRVRCETCKVSIGHVVTASTMQLWSYGVRVVSTEYSEADEEPREVDERGPGVFPTQQHIKCKDTFLDILNGAISESLEPIPRFYFISPSRVSSPHRTTRN
jgi:hypothetical protein